MPSPAKELWLCFCDFMEAFFALNNLAKTYSLTEFLSCAISLIDIWRIPLIRAVHAIQPTSSSSYQPSSLPAAIPTTQPSNQPTISPSSQPTSFPSTQPIRGVSVRTTATTAETAFLRRCWRTRRAETTARPEMPWRAWAASVTRATEVPLVNCRWEYIYWWRYVLINS